MSNLNQRMRGPALWSLLLVAVLGSVWITGFTPAHMRSWGDAGTFVREMFPPDWSVLPKVLKGMVETVAIAFLGTALASLIAFPASFLTARNIGPKWLGALIRAVMSLLRSVPEILFALIFVMATEFGDVPGVLALAAHNIGILTKLFGEIFEAAPPGPLEAMTATGAGRGTVIWYGVLPAATPGLLSHWFFRFECNIRTATILGVVGAGGIGELLMRHKALFNYNAMAVDTLGILALVVLADALGAIVRKQVT